MNSLWWTEADEAELAVLLDEFLKHVRIHRDACSVCRTGGPYCASLDEAFDVLLEWRRGRELRSKAQWLRAREMAREAA